MILPDMWAKEEKKKENCPSSFLYSSHLLLIDSTPQKIRAVLCVSFKKQPRISLEYR